MAGMLDKLRSYLDTGTNDEYEVAEYVLERREPDPEPRAETFDDPVTPDDVTAEADLPSGEYLLQEIKASGMAGDVVWEAELDFEEELEA